MVNVSLYAIEAPMSGLVKIGSSSDPTHRFKTIQAMSPEILTPRIISPVNGRQLEKYFHKQFEHLRHHGEWFKQKPELIVALFREEFKQHDEAVIELTWKILGEVLGKN